MKKVTLIALMLAFAIGSAVAQPPGGPGSGSPGGNGDGNFGSYGNPVNPVDRLVERLGLDENQAAAIALIFEEHLALREEERAAARAAAEEAQAILRAQIMELLTPEQQALYEDQLKQRDALRQALQDLNAERGMRGGRGTGECSG